jgi:hypothetical protein
VSKKICGIEFYINEEGQPILILSAPTDDNMLSIFSALLQRLNSGQLINVFVSELSKQHSDKALRILELWSDYEQKYKQEQSISHPCVKPNEVFKMKDSNDDEDD